MVGLQPKVELTNVLTSVGGLLLLVVDVRLLWLGRSGNFLADITGLVLG